MERSGVEAAGQVHYSVIVLADHLMTTEGEEQPFSLAPPFPRELPLLLLLLMLNQDCVASLCLRFSHLSNYISARFHFNCCVL